MTMPPRRSRPSRSIVPSFTATIGVPFGAPRSIAWCFLWRPREALKVSRSFSFGKASIGSGKSVAKRAASSSSGMEAGLLSFFLTTSPFSVRPRFCQKDFCSSEREGSAAGTTEPWG